MLWKMIFLFNWVYSQVNHVYLPGCIPPKKGHFCGPMIRTETSPKPHHGVCRDDSLLIQWTSSSWHPLREWHGDIGIFYHGKYPYQVSNDTYMCIYIIYIYIYIQYIYIYICVHIQYIYCTYMYIYDTWIRYVCGDISVDTYAQVYLGRRKWLK